MFLDVMELPDDTHLDCTLFGGENIGTNIEDNPTMNEGLNHYVDEMSSRVEKLERRLNDVEHYYSHKNPLHASKASSTKNKDKDRHIFSVKKKQQDSSRRATIAAKRMQELTRQFTTILGQITQHEWAWPFLEPVDVEGLGLQDYYKGFTKIGVSNCKDGIVIDKPMDFSTIKKRMEAIGGTGYKSVRDIFTDCRLVFTNAMKYNDDRTDVHVMAKALLEKLEEKWLTLLPKIVKEEKRLKEEERQAVLGVNFTQETIHAKIARDLCSELDEVEIPPLLKMTTKDKTKLGAALSKLSSEDLAKALEIVAQGCPNFQAAAAVVELDMDYLSEITLWRLKLFVKGTLDVHANNDDNNNNDYKRTVDSNKRRREISEALDKIEKKRIKRCKIAPPS